MRLLQVLAASIIFGLTGSAWSAITGGTVYFEPNRGQSDPRFKYLARTANGTVYLSDEAIALAAKDAAKDTGVVEIEFTGANRKAEWIGGGLEVGTTSYYRGRDRKNWIENVAHYRRLRRPSIYPGIDLELYGNGGNLEYDLVVGPGADPDVIRFRLRGVRGLRLQPDGSLHGETTAGPVIHRRPVLFQTNAAGVRVPVKGGYRITGPSEAGFEVKSYDGSMALTIDPVLETSSYFGGNLEESVFAVDGLFAIAGATTSTDFPGTAPRRSYGKDIFVRTRFPERTLIIGGSGDEEVTTASFSPLAQGQVIVVGGYTNSRDLPVQYANPLVQGAWQPDYAGGISDGFVLVYDSLGRTPIFLTYYGTPGEDRVLASASAGTAFMFGGETNGAGLRSTLEIRPLQASPRGGTDGFFVRSTLGQQFVAASYLGGAGDDRVTAVSFTGPTSIVVAGETSSADFLPEASVIGPRGGPSDAFAMAVDQAQQGGIRSVIVGGSGRDSVTALSVGGGITLGGFTDSPDLALAAPAQASFAGGDSDGMLFHFTSDLSRVLYSTYVGGSGADRVNAVSFFGFKVIAAGSTSSLDFPLAEPIQSQFGGGEQDGFVVRYDRKGPLLFSSYYGGSESDRILCLANGSIFEIYFGGETRSADLPGTAGAPGIQGRSDGFTGKLAEFSIAPEPLAGGKDLRHSGGINLGLGPALTAVEATLTVGDPSLVLLSTEYDGPGAPSITLPPPLDLTFPARPFYYDCLSDSGSTAIAVTAPGYEGQTLTVNCFASEIRIFQQADSTLGIYSPPARYSVYLAARDPASETPLALGLRPGARPVSIGLTVSDPSLGRINPSRIEFTSRPDPPFLFLFQPVRVGEADLEVSSPIPLARPVKFVVRSPLTVTGPIAVAAGFQTVAALQVGLGVPSGLRGTVRSTNPEVATVSASDFAPAMGEIPYTLVPGVWIRGQRPGTSTLEFRLDGQPAATTAITVTPPYTMVRSMPHLHLAPGESKLILAAITSETGAAVAGPNPGVAPPAYSVQSSNPGVASVTANGPIFTIRGVAPGTATISTRAPEAYPMHPQSANPISVTVSRGMPVFPDVDVGKDLMATMTLTLPSAAAQALTVTASVERPELVQLAPGLGLAAQSRINLPVAANSRTLTFAVYGLASSGQTRINLEVPGYGTLPATVRLTPSGIGWQLDRVVLEAYSPAQAVSISPMALDPETMIPIAAQLLRPGVSGIVPVSSQSPEVASLSSSEYRLPQISGLAVTPVSVGETVLAITQPEGFLEPASRHRLAVRVTPRALPLLLAARMGVNTVTGLSLALPRTVALTVTSNDPHLLQISGTLTDPPAPSLTTSGPFFLLHALGETGTASYSVTATGYASVTARVSILPMTVVVRPNAPFLNGTASVTTASPGIRLQLSLRLAGVEPFLGRARWTLRPGFDAVEVEVRSSNPVVGNVLRTPVRVQAEDAFAEFQPVAPGVTDIQVVQPPGFREAPDAGFRIEVTRPPP